MHATGTRPTPSPEQALLVSRIIGGSMGMGVTLFAIVSWYTHQDAVPPDPPGDPAVVFNIMLVVAAAAVVAAIVLWRARVEPLVHPPSRAETAADEDWAVRWGRLQTGLVIIWALMEGASLFAVVVYFLYGITTAGVLGVLLIWTGLALTWPKREWLEAVH